MAYFLDIASIEIDFKYKKCCNDNLGELNKLNLQNTKINISSISEGLQPLGTLKLEPSTCSQRTCDYSNSSTHTVWNSKQVNSFAV